jgi:prefoldin subunit 5
MADQSQFIIRVTAEAFKNIKVVDFVPNRFITKISGANGAGKTSAIDAIFNALAPRKTVPPHLLRQGQKKGFLRIETNSHIVTRRLDEKGGGLEIEAKATGTLLKAPDDWLAGMAGDLGFDPLKFMRMKPEEQFDVLKGLVKMEEDIDDLETRNENDSETLKKIKAEAKAKEHARDELTVDKTLATETVDIDALLAEARAVTDHNRAIDQQEREREDHKRERDQVVRAIEDRTQRIGQLRAELDRMQKANDADSADLGKRNEAIAAWKPLAAHKDRHELDERISAASTTNQRVTVNNNNREQRAKLDNEVDGIKDKMKALEDATRVRKLTIARTLEKAKFPVKGLSFDTVEEGSSGRERKNPKKIVTYNGIPLADASSAEQIRVSTAIGMAGKPDLRFLLIREGSLLDENGWTILEQMAHENNFQILSEVVDTTGKVGIFLEDGTIKAVNAEQDTAAAATPAKKAARKSKNEKQGQLIK